MDDGLKESKSRLLLLYTIPSVAYPPIKIRSEEKNLISE